MAKDKKDIPRGEKKNWYTDRYEFVSVQRNIFALITLLSLVLSVVATFAVSQLTPLKSVEPFVIQIDQKSGMTQVVNPVQAREIAANESVNQYFIVQYCRARESFVGSNERNLYNYNLVRVLSAKKTFYDYQRDIVLTNPLSPGARLGAGGDREIQIQSIKFLDKHKISPNSNEENLRYLVNAKITEKGKGMPVAGKVSQKIILIEFQYVDIELTTEERYLNPLGFRVISYRIDDDNVTG